MPTHGGARPGAGAKPDPNSIRSANGQGGEWITLPAEGRVGQPLPDWPLEPRATRRERELWARLWRKPQAIMWERHGLHDEVGQYVRLFTEAEVPGAPVNVRTGWRQLADSLGITMPGMRMHRWKIGEVAKPLAATGTEAARARRRSSRERFEIVPEPPEDDPTE